MYTLSSLHLTAFKKAFLHYVKRFGITGWTLEFHHETATDSMACIRVQLDGRRADVYLSTEWEDEPTTDRLKEKAKHEVGHLFVARMAHLASKRCVTADELYEAEEELVAMITKAVKV